MVEIWYVDLDAPAPPVLSADEHARASRYARGDDGRRWAAGRAALRMLIGERAGVHPREVGFVHGPHGKPHVEDGPCFNLSHAGTIALVALGGAREVGIDVERTDRRSHAILRALTASEREAIGEAPAHLELMRIWCRKEALAKATGGGLRWASERFDTTAPQGYVLADLDVAAGHLAALALEGAPPAPPPRSRSRATRPTRSARAACPRRPRPHGRRPRAARRAVPGAS